MIRRLAQASVDHRGWVVGLTLALAIFAVLASLRLKLDALPDLTNNQVVVLTVAPGLTPEEVERAVTRPLEVALGGLPRLEEHRSLSRYGISSVTLVFEDGVAPTVTRQAVAERLGTVQLPPGVERPELAPLTGGLGEVFHVTLSSPRRTPAELLELSNLRVTPLLKSVPGVVEVNAWGGAVRTFDVVVDPAKLTARKLGLSQVRDALADSTGALAAGALAAPAGQVLVRAQSRPSTTSEVGAALVQRPGVTASALGEVVEGQRLRLGAATANGQGETLYLMVQMLRDANALEVVDGVHGRLPAVRAVLPEDVRLDVVYDRSVLVKGTLRTVALNLLEGGLLVTLVLLIFLGSLRAGLLVAAVIPLSMAFAGAAMTALDIPGNLMSLGALDFGLLVDGAVVLVEGVFHGARGKSLDGRPAVRALVRDVAGGAARPVFFSVVVILLVYVPVLLLTGVDGKLFRPMALTVVFALSAALVLSLTFIPAAASFVLRPKDLQAEEPWVVRALQRLYPRLLAPGLRHRGGVAAGAVVLLLVGGGLLVTRGIEFTPQLDEGHLVIMTTRGADTSLELSVERAGHLERTLLSPRFPEVRQVVSRVGSPAVATDIMGLEQADVFVSLAPQGEWRPGLTREALLQDIEAALVAGGEDAELAFTQPIQMRFNELLGGAVTDVVVNVFGEDLSQLYAVAQQVAASLEGVPGAVDVRVLAPPEVPLLTVRPRPLDAAAAGLSVREVMEAVQAVQVGLVVGDTWDGPVRVPVRLKLAADGSAAALPGLLVPVPEGGVVPLSRVADVTAEATPGLVNRHQGQRRLQVGFNVRGADLGTVVQAAQARVPAAPAGVRLAWGGQYESLEAAAGRLMLVVPLVLLLIIGVLVFTFSRFRPALIVSTLVPFAGVGGVAILAVRGMPISLPAVIGFIALSGIAVMNGVVWVTRTLELEDTLSSAEAARQAAVDRARPVLMTALVAAVGFLPMMLATGVGAEVQRPLATVVVGGLVSSTFLTLLVLPALWPWLRGRG